MFGEFSIRCYPTSVLVNWHFCHNFIQISVCVSVNWHFCHNFIQISVWGVWHQVLPLIYFNFFLLRGVSSSDDFNKFATGNYTVKCVRVILKTFQLEIIQKKTSCLGSLAAGVAAHLLQLFSAQRSLVIGWFLTNLLLEIIQENVLILKTFQLEIIQKKTSSDDFNKFATRNYTVKCLRIILKTFLLKIIQKKTSQDDFNNFSTRNYSGKMS